MAEKGMRVSMPGQGSHAPLCSRAGDPAEGADIVSNLVKSLGQLLEQDQELLVLHGRPPPPSLPLPDRPEIEACSLSTHGGTWDSPLDLALSLVDFSCLPPRFSLLSKSFSTFPLLSFCPFASSRDTVRRPVPEFVRACICAPYMAPVARPSHSPPNSVRPQSQALASAGALTRSWHPLSSRASCSCPCLCS